MVELGRKVVGLLIALLLVGMCIGIGIGYAIWGAMYAPVTYETRKIVGLLPLTGVLGTFGENSKETALLAMRDVNDWLKRNGRTWRLEVIIDDTKTDAPTALSKMTSWFGAGVKFFFGPMSSGECKECKSYADANRIIYVSPSSTSPALREKDYLFRFCPHDFVQGPGLARLIWDAGVRHLIFTWRGDTWGDGLQSAVEKRFIELGGKVYKEYYVRYDPGKEDFPSEAALLNDYVKSLVDAGVPLEEIGINAISFEEIAPYMEDADAYPLLRQVKWFGSDGTALSSKLKEHPVAAKFARDTKFASTLFTPGLSKYPLFDYVRAHVYEVLGRETDAYSLNTYDIVWCLALAIDKVGYDPEKVKEILPKITDERTAVYAASGHIILDENGDRALADYDIWILNEKLEWEKVGVWRSATDTVAWTRKIYG